MVTTAGEEREILLTGFPPLPTRSLEEDAGVVSRSGRSCPPGRSGHNRADHGGVQETLPHRTPPPPPTPGETITIYVPPSPIDDSVPKEEYI